MRTLKRNAILHRIQERGYLRLGQSVSALDRRFASAARKCVGDHIAVFVAVDLAFLFKQLGKKRAYIDVCQDVRYGVDLEAVRAERLYLETEFGKLADVPCYEIALRAVAFQNVGYQQRLRRRLLGVDLGGQFVVKHSLVHRVLVDQICLVALLDDQKRIEQLPYDLVPYPEHTVDLAECVAVVPGRVVSHLERGGRGDLCLRLVYAVGEDRTLFDPLALSVESLAPLVLILRLDLRRIGNGDRSFVGKRILHRRVAAHGLERYDRLFFPRQKHGARLRCERLFDRAVDRRENFVRLTKAHLVF